MKAKAFTALALTFAWLQASLVAEITAPKSVPAGSPFECTWTGEDPQGPFHVVSETGHLLKSEARGYLNKQNKIALHAPNQPGTYGVGLVKGGATTELKTFEVTAVSATLSAPEFVTMNASVEVKWTGPAYGQDTVSIVEVGATRRSALYTYPANSSNGTLSLKAPIEPGKYEVVYFMRGEALARLPISVGGTAAALQVATTIQAGGDIEVIWEGPNNSQDTISLVKAGAEKGRLSYTYTNNSTSNRVTLIAPEDLGDYDVIYVTGGKALARVPVKVVEVSASLEAPSEVVAKYTFGIQWTGPGNRGDHIIMAGAAEVAKAFVIRDEPEVTMTAPATPKDYVLHYVSRGGKSLATRPITVTPAPSDPGFLKIDSDPATSFGENTAIELILDASGSMLKRQGDKRRIEIAKETILELLSDVIPSGTGFAMRVFGHKEADSCRTDLEIPFGPLDLESSKLTVAAIQATNLAKTPIAASLELVGADMLGVTGERIVILVTDGEETCDGDPALAIRQLRSEGSDLRVNIVGYSIDDEALRETFQSWAAIGGGQYLDAPDADQLGNALRRALEIPYEVFKGDTLVVHGVSGGKRHELAEGNYQLRYRWNGHEMTKEIAIKSTVEAAIQLP